MLITDLIIGSLVSVTCLIAAPYLLIHAGGWTGVRGALPATHFQVLGNLSLVRALEFLVPTLLLMLGNQGMYQKFFSAKSERDARRAVVGWVVGTVILETAIIAICGDWFGDFSYRRSGRSILGKSLLTTARHGLPAFLGALLLAAVFAKVISTASNFLFSPATNLVNDVFVRYISPDASNKRVLIVSRLTVGAAGVLGALPGCVCREHPREDAVCVHGLFGCFDTGHPGGVLLEAGHTVGCGGGDCDGHDCYCHLGSACSEVNVSAGCLATRCHLSGVVCCRVFNDRG